MATILTKRSNTASSVPVAGDLTNSSSGAELAVNTADKRLFTKDSGGTVVELGTNPSSLTLPNGTANGLAFLNASKVLTSGSALTFDGSALVTSGVVRGSTFQASNSNGLTLSDDVSGGFLSYGYNSGRTNAANHVWYNGITSELMRLTSTGLGIGTSSPSYKLDVRGNIVGGTGTIQTAITYDTMGSIGTFSNHGLRIITNSAGVAVFDTSGNLGIGTSSPVARLTVSGVAGNGNGLMSVDGSDFIRLFADATFGSAINWSAGDSLRFATSDSSFGSFTERMRLDSSGNLGLGVTPSAWSSGGNIEIVSGGIYAGAGPVTNYSSNAYYDTSWKYKTTAAASYFRQANGAFNWFTAPSGTAGNAISFTQAMTLDASARLGIGTTTTTEKLNIGASGASSVFIRFLHDSDNTGYIGYNGSALTFSTATTERARIDSSGNLLVGTTSVANISKTTIGFDGYSVNGLSVNDTTATATSVGYVNFSRSGTSKGSISYSDTTALVSYNTTSDYRAKDIIGPVTDSGSVIDSVPVYIGKMKGATQERPMFIAHETPYYAHTGEKDAVDADGNPVYQQMDASALVPILWAEVQSLRARVAALESN
jgi:hypothetical protein